MILGHSISVFNHSNCLTREQIIGIDEPISFDGVYKSVYDNRDILVGKDVVLFVMGDYVGLDNTFDVGRHFDEKFCTWKEIEELHKMGCKLGWHTWSHRDLTELSDEEVIKEITAPFDTVCFSYPYGITDHRVTKLVKKAGYKHAYSVTSGDDTPFELRRRYL